MRPSRLTVQAPHSPTRQHSFVPVRPRSSRRTSSRVWWAGTSSVRPRPFTVSSIGNRRCAIVIASPPPAARSRSPAPAHRGRAAWPGGTRGSARIDRGDGLASASIPLEDRGPRLVRRRRVRQHAGLVERAGRDAARRCRRRAGSTPASSTATAERDRGQVVAAAPRPPDVYGPPSAAPGAGARSRSPARPRRGWSPRSARRTRRRGRGASRAARRRPAPPRRRGAAARCPPPGEALQRLPTSVARLRIWTDPTTAAASASAGKWRRTRSSSATSVITVVGADHETIALGPDRRAQLGDPLHVDDQLRRGGSRRGDG